ncbi:MAG: hypothetical protein Ct9H300mP27_01600 [Chloroflexota bacterium]|nr:MAG: hypothetical protein Ct9H300mP27_01600 [Chloroflexota bacterium]
MDGGDQVSVAFFGDGASNEGLSIVLLILPQSGSYPSYTYVKIMVGLSPYQHPMLFPLKMFL